MMLGLRPGELTGLRWDDVDLEDGTMIVSGSLKNERRAATTRRDQDEARQGRELPTRVLAALRAHSTARRKSD